MLHNSFPLSTLLKLRQIARDESRQRLAESRRADAEIERQLGTLAESQGRLAQARRRAIGPGRLDVGQLTVVDRYDKTLRAKQKRLRDERQTLAEEIQRRRESLLAAERKVQSLEKLRQRRLEQHRLAEDRREARQLDEAAAQVAKTTDSQLLP